MPSLTLPERRLATELVISLAWLVRDWRSDDPHYAEHGYSYHCHMSAQEGAFAILFDLGVAYGAVFKGYDLVVKDFTVRNASDGCRHPIYCKPFEDGEIRETLASTPDSEWPPLEDLIAAFLNWACVYGGPALSTERAPFTPREKFVAAMTAFEEFGYARRPGTQFQWTHAAAPHMRAARLWKDGS